jgi:hypothetical protein
LDGNENSQQILTVFNYSRLSCICLSHLCEPYETLSSMRNFSGPFDRIYGRVDCRRKILKSLPKQIKYWVAWKFFRMLLKLCKLKFVYVIPQIFAFFICKI